MAGGGGVHKNLFCKNKQTWRNLCSFLFLLQKAKMPSCQRSCPYRYTNFTFSIGKLYRPFHKIRSNQYVFLPLIERSTSMFDEFQMGKISNSLCVRSEHQCVDIFFSQGRVNFSSRKDCTALTNLTYLLIGYTKISWINIWFFVELNVLWFLTSWAFLLIQHYFYNC